MHASLNADGRRDGQSKKSLEPGELRSKFESQTRYNKFTRERAQEQGYDSTWSEVEQILDGVLVQGSKFHFFSQVKEKFGVVATVLVANMVNDKEHFKGLLAAKADITDLKICQLSRVADALKGLLSNFAVSMGEFSDDKKPMQNFFVQKVLPQYSLEGKLKPHLKNL